MGELLRSFEGGEGIDETSKSEARQAIEDLPEDTFATAIVELASPMAEEEVNSVLGAPGIQSDALYLFLSRRLEGSEKPIYWRSCAIYESECENTAATQLFQRWVSKLHWTDKLNLKNLGLDIDVLRQVAREGRIYGLLAYGYSEKFLAEIIEKPEVRTVKIVATARG
ncbi:hypothetical protein ACQEVF_49370 [Nonomuraea polychroma]|uniref:hypothetical protein n=1 Tax=Nonomuraea polychroma TaxID=46176 RepID=UPI003D939AE2